MTLHLLTIDYRHAPIAFREKLAFPEHILPTALADLQEAGASEAAILSTCNRVELIALLPANLSGREFLVGFLSRWHQISRSRIEEHCLHLSEQAAAGHLIRVACGLESLVPGEMQILGQVKAAAKTARGCGTIGPILDRLFATAVSAGRRARNDTAIARRPVSISHAAVELVKMHFNQDLAGRKVLLIGSGKMGEVAAQQLHKAGAAHFMVANRTLERACEMAQQWDGTPLPLDDLPGVLMKADAIISATAAPHQILHADHVQRAMSQRPERELLVIDLAVPRDIDPDVATIPGVVLCDVDGLQQVVAENIELRNSEREAVEQIAGESLQRFLSERAARRVAPTITSLRQSADAIRQTELEKALSRLNHLSAEEQEVIEALSRGLMNKLLHQPTVRLREKAATEQAQLFQQFVEELFDLDRETAS